MTPDLTIAALCFRVRLVLHAQDSALLGAMEAKLPHAAAILASTSPAPAQPASCDESDAPPDGHFSVVRLLGEAGFRSLADGVVTSESRELSVVLDQLGQDLMVHVANFCPDRVFVHAGVVAWHDRALLLPGPSFAGKTTLTAALVRAGATYYSDEYAVLDESGQVHPYARDLQMRSPGRPEQRSLPVSQLRGVAGHLPLPVSDVFFVRFSAGSSWSPEPVSSGMAALEMLLHTIPVQRTPARVMAVLARTLAQASAWRTDRDEADAAAQALLRGLL